MSAVVRQLHRHRWWLLLALVVAVAGTCYHRRASGLEWGLELEAGKLYRYAYSWRLSERTHLAGLVAGVEARGSADEISTEVDLSGTLEIREHQPGVLAIAFGSIDDHRLELMGQPLLPEQAEARAILAGREAYVTLGEGGRFDQIQLPDGAPELYGQTLKGLLAELMLDLRPHQPRWEAVESTLRGRSEVTWEADGDRRATKVRRRYLGLRAMAQARELGSDRSSRSSSAPRQATRSSRRPTPWARWPTARRPRRTPRRSSRRRRPGASSSPACSPRRTLRGSARFSRPWGTPASWRRRARSSPTLARKIRRSGAQPRRR